MTRRLIAWDRDVKIILLILGLSVFVAGMIGLLLYVLISYIPVGN